MNRDELKAELQAEYGVFTGWLAANPKLALLVALAVGFVVGYVVHFK